MVFFVDKPKGDPNEGIEDVVDLVEDALKYTKDGDSDASSVTSSVIEGVVSGNEPTSPKAHDITNEIALPAESEPALLSHKLSESESSPGHVTSNIDHVTTISVGGLEPRVERLESIEKARHASNREDPRLSMRMDEEITLGQEEIMYVASSFVFLESVFGDNTHLELISKFSVCTGVIS